MDVEYLPTSTKGYTLAPGIYEVTDNNMMLKSLLPKEVKVIMIIDDIRLKSNLTIKKQSGLLIFLNVVLGFTQSHLGELGDIDGFVQLIPGS